MKLAFCDGRRLGVCVQREDGSYFNWNTRGWESPFQPLAHLETCAPRDTTTPALGLVQWADLGPALERAGQQGYAAAVLILWLDPATGAVLSVADVWSPWPFQAALSAPGGWVPAWPGGRSWG